MNDIKSDPDLWEIYQDIAETNHGIIPIEVPDNVDTGRRFTPMFKYVGVNGTATLGDMANYDLNAGWRGYVSRGRQKAVVQVFYGELVGSQSTWDNDGFVIEPDETLAVFDVRLLR